MRKVLLLSALACMFLFSCKKDHTASTSPSGKKYKVTFNVSNFTATQQAGFAVRHTGSNLASDTITKLSGYLDVLYYVVYDSNGNAVKPPLMQDSTMSSMGMITDSLPAGNYSIAIVAGKKGLALTGYSSEDTGYFNYGGPNWQDTFYNNFPITVNDAPVSQSVMLYRQVGKIELNLQDDMPATADSLFMTVFPEANAIQMDGIPVEPLTGTSTLAVAIPASAKGLPNYTVDELVGPTNTSVIVTIVCKDAAHNILGSATVKNVKMQLNVKTLVTGDLFTGLAPSQSFQVQVDTAWSTTHSQADFSLRRH